MEKAWRAEGGGSMQIEEKAPLRPIELRRMFWKLLIEQKSAAFAEITRIIGVIEGKAEKTAVSSGALIGLGVPILIKSDIPQRARVPVDCVLFVAMVLLLVAFGLCLSVAWARDVKAPPQMGEMQRMLGDVLMLGDDELSESVELGAYKEQSDYWDAALEAHSQRADQKGKRLRIAQGFLAAGVCVLAAAILMILMGSFL